MIVSLNGQILDLFLDRVVLEVHGVGYECFISRKTFDSLNKHDSDFDIKLIIYHHISEGNQCLFGFTDYDEKSIFLLLISVSGIGPKTAIQFLSNVTSRELQEKIMIGDVKGLTSIPGIGTKTAKRIIVELKDKFTSVNKDDLPYENDNIISPLLDDATKALMELGYNKNEVTKNIKKIIKDEGDLDTGELIKRVLNIIGK